MLQGKINDKATLDAFRKVKDLECARENRGQEAKLSQQEDQHYREATKTVLQRRGMWTKDLETEILAEYTRISRQL
jgi:hypothetical protein